MVVYVQSLRVMVSVWDVNWNALHAYFGWVVPIPRLSTSTCDVLESYQYEMAFFTNKDTLHPICGWK
jgi:hypothetical protein